MTADLEKLMANLGDPERERLRGALAADPELAAGLASMLAGLPEDAQTQMVRRLGARLASAPPGGGALVAALADVIQDALDRSDREGGHP